MTRRDRLYTYSDFDFRTAKVNSFFVEKVDERWSPENPYGRIVFTAMSDNGEHEIDIQLSTKEFRRFLIQFMLAYPRYALMRLTQKLTGRL